MISYSFRTALMLRITVVIALTLLVVGGFTYVRVSDIADIQAKHIIQHTTRLIEGQLKLLLDTTEDQARLVASASGPTPRPELTALGDSLFQSLKVHDQFSMIRVVFDKTGESVTANYDSTGQPQIQINRVSGDVKESVGYHQFGSGLKQDDAVPIAWPQETKADLDRYENVKSSPTPTWSEVTGPVPGYIISTPITGPNEEFVGVAEIEISVSELSSFLGLIRVGDSGYTFIIDDEVKEDGKNIKVNENPIPPHVAAYPNVENLVIGQGQSSRVASFKELKDPRLMAYLAAYQKTDPHSPEVQQFSFTAQNIRYLASRDRKAEGLLPSWSVGIIVPEDQFTSGAKSIFLIFAAFMVLALAVGILMSLLISRRVTRPLTMLAREAERVQGLDLTPRPMRRTGITEIDELSSSMERMKTSLRSLEKLVPSDYARFLMSSGLEAKLGGERRHITTYFGDIVGFTALSHELAPEDLMEVLTEYLDVLSTQVLKHGGTIDKFNGDDVMAFWGAPTMTTDHAFSACEASLASLKAITSLHTEWRDHGRPILNASFGIATGDVIVGNVGNGQRMNYTVIGDSVNMASRLQGANKFFGTQILIGQGTYTEAGNRICTRWIDRVFVAGREEAVDVYELLALAGEATDHQKLMQECHNLARTAYLARKWDVAEENLRRVAASDPHDGPSSILIARLYEFRQRPPLPEWDGAHPLAGK